jgi:hypothetical protein
MIPLWFSLRHQTWHWDPYDTCNIPHALVQDELVAFEIRYFNLFEFRWSIKLYHNMSIILKNNLVCLNKQKYFYLYGLFTQHFFMDIMQYFMWNPNHDCRHSTFNKGSWRLANYLLDTYMGWVDEAGDSGVALPGVSFFFSFMLPWCRTLVLGHPWHPLFPPYLSIYLYHRHMTENEVAYHSI